MGSEQNGPFPQMDPAEETSASIYEIRVRGTMDQEFWSDWFGGMEVSINPDQEETTLLGYIADQAELYGLLSRLRNKSLTLISVRQI